MGANLFYFKHKILGVSEIANVRQLAYSALSPEHTAVIIKTVSPEQGGAFWFNICCRGAGNANGSRRIQSGFGRPLGSPTAPSIN